MGVAKDEDKKGKERKGREAEGRKERRRVRIPNQAGENGTRLDLVGVFKNERVFWEKDLLVRVE